MSKKKCECPAGESGQFHMQIFKSSTSSFYCFIRFGFCKYGETKSIKRGVYKIYKFPSTNIVEEQTKQEKAMTDEPSDDNVEGKKKL